MDEPDLDPDDIIVLARRAPNHYHRRRDCEEVKPACYAELVAGKWREKEFRHVDGWKAPCRNPRCFGEREDPPTLSERLRQSRGEG